MFVERLSFPRRLARTRKETRRQDSERAHPPLIPVYTHPTPVAAEIILRHTAFFFLELIGAVRFRGPGKAPGTKNESVPTLPLTQQDPHSWLHSAKTATLPSPPLSLRPSPHAHISSTHAITAARETERPQLREMSDVDARKVTKRVKAVFVGVEENTEATRSDSSLLSSTVARK